MRRMLHLGVPMHRLEVDSMEAVAWMVKRVVVDWSLDVPVMNQ